MPNIKPGGPTKVRRTLDQEIQGIERAKTDLEKYLEQLYRARTESLASFPTREKAAVPELPRWWTSCNRPSSRCL
jgi:hypothetical protein